MKKQFFVAAMALVLGTGFTACSSDDLNTKGVDKELTEKASTYMSVSFQLPTSIGTRAADDGQDKDPSNFNPVGKWEGQDKIEKVLVYVFNASNVLEAKQPYTGAQLAFTQDNTGSGKAKVTPNTAFKVTPGQKTVFVVVNPTTAAEALLPSVVGTTTLTDFQNKYQSADLALTKPTRLTAEYTSGDETRAGEVAKVDGTGTNAKDIILMTGKEATQNVEDNVSASQAVSGLKNRVELEVQRAVARVLLTTRTASFEIEGVDPENPSATNFKVAEISDITYVVAQGEAKFFFQQKVVNPPVDGSGFTTPAFGIKNGTHDYWSQAGIDDYITVGKHYDYSGLWKHTAGAAAPVKGIKVPTRAQFDSNAANELGHVTADLRDGLDGEFTLPNLHKFVSGDRTNTGYRKGNTAYILVRALLKPKKYVDATGHYSTTAVTAPQDWYLGANGVFYAKKEHVQDPTNKGVAGQTAQLFKGGKVLYFLWLNPDDIQKPINSPSIRNNIYHVQIAGVGKIGANWNPLVPFPDPTPNPKPGEPINPNPNNPDPRPDNPFEPVTPPVDPTDPLSDKETWMSVNVSIIPWQVHSYEIIL